MYNAGVVNLFVADPDVMQGINENNHVIEKNSMMKKYIFDDRLGDNLLSNLRSQNQIQRRRAMMSMFSGSANF